MGKLESHSLWYRYKTEVWPKDTEQSVTVHNIMRVLRSVRNLKELGYLSLALTSGKLYYEVLAEEREAPDDEMMHSIMDCNFRQGLKTLDRLISKSKIPMIFPADLMPRGGRWGQEHFQALWLSIIAERCTRVYMKDGWAYSNGASEEFVHAYQLKLGLPEYPGLFFWNTKEHEEKARERMRSIKVYDERCRLLSIDEGIRQIEEARDWIYSNIGLGKKRVARLENCIRELEWTGDMIEKGFYQ